MFLQKKALKIIAAVIVFAVFMLIGLFISSSTSFELNALQGKEGSWDLLNERCLGEPSNC